MAEIIGQKDNFGAVQVIGLTQFIKDIKKARDKGAADVLIREANERVAKVVIRMARTLANTKQERRSANSLEVSSSTASVQVRMGGKAAPYAGGANFGSYQNQRRLIKAPNQRGRRSRATRVREGESLLKVATRVENQFVSRSGRTIKRREGTEENRVKLATNSRGGFKVINGWNNFRAKGGSPTPYAKGKDQFLFRAVTLTQDQISQSYQQFIDKMLGDAFPDKSQAA